MLPPSQHTTDTIYRPRMQPRARTTVISMRTIGPLMYTAPHQPLPPPLLPPPLVSALLQLWESKPRAFGRPRSSDELLRPRNASQRLLPNGPGQLFLGRTSRRRPLHIMSSMSLPCKPGSTPPTLVPSATTSTASSRTACSITHSWHSQLVWERPSSQPPSCSTTLGGQRQQRSFSSHQRNP